MSLGMNLVASLILKQFRTQSCLSYLMADRGSRKAVLIDPHLELMDEYRSYLGENGLDLKWVLETQTHTDHFSGSHLLQKAYGAKIGMSALTLNERCQLRLEHAQELDLGSIKILAIQTPGHTPDSICFFAGGRLLFSGGTLSIGSTGRGEHPDATPSLHWQSLQELMKTVPGPSIVLPAHDFNSQLFSTMQAEMKVNPYCLSCSAAAFTALKAGEHRPSTRDEVFQVLEFNQRNSPVFTSNPQRAGNHFGVSSLGRVPTIPAEKLVNKLDEAWEGNLLIDVRESDEFQAGHIPKSENIPLSELCLHLDRLRQHARIYLSCQTGRRSQMAVTTLSYLGLGDVVSVSGGFQAWTQAGYPVARG